MHNDEHVLARLLERAANKSDDEKHIIRKTALGLLKKAKARTLPNADWFRTIRQGEKPLGYFCGTGVVIRTYLHEDMTPHGQEV